MHRFALFDYGFRPFFLIAGVYALVVVPIWLFLYGHQAVPFGALPAMYWHAHEMVYGFVSAAIAGFLLTSVPSWTGARGFAGAPLYALVAAWLAGRIAMTMFGHWPVWIIAIAELSMLPLLAALLLPPLLRTRNRNVRLLFVLLMLWSADAAFVWAVAQGDVGVAARSISFAINLVLVLVTVIGGRIVPAFTANALRRRGESSEIVSHTWLEVSVISSMIIIAVLDAFVPLGSAHGIIAGAAAILHVIRLSGWRSFHTRGESILWVLHLAYAWLPIGLALKAFYLFGGFDWASKWQHALTAGVFGTMILAVMTRASLGHTGRPLAVSRSTTFAYALLTLAVCIRVLSGAVNISIYRIVVEVAGAAWSLAFLLYLITYTPVLVLPRADGKPG